LKLGTRLSGFHQRFRPFIPIESWAPPTPIAYLDTTRWSIIFGSAGVRSKREAEDSKGKERQIMLFTAFAVLSETVIKFPSER